MKRMVLAIGTILLATGCDPTTVVPEQLPPGTKAVILNLTATKTYVPNADYADGTHVMDKDTVITLPTSIGVTAGNAGNGNRVVLSFAGGTVDSLVGIRCYFTSSGGTGYAFSSCDGGEGGGGVWPYYNAGDAVKIVAGDTLVLRVQSGDNSAPTTVSVAIAGIQSN